MIVNMKKISRIGVLSSLSLIIFMVESLFPPIFMFAPGTKLGLSGMIITLTLVMYDEKSALFVLLIKCFLGAVFSGNLFMMYYSLPAGLGSLVMGSFLFKYVFPKLSIISISAACAIVHNVAQIIMAAILFKSVQFLYYICIVSFAGLLAGLCTGICLFLIIKFVPLKTLAGD